MRVAITLMGAKTRRGLQLPSQSFDVLIRHQTARLTAEMFVWEDCGEGNAPFKRFSGRN